MSTTSAGGQLLYPNLRGDLDANPTLLAQLQALAKRLGKTFTVTSGKRTFAEQQALYNNRANNPYPVAKPGTSKHETGNAADVLVDGKPIQDAVDPLALQAMGLVPLKGDAVHVELGTPSYVNGGIVGGAAGAIAGAGDAINSGANAAAGAAGNVAADAAKATANALVGLVVDAIGKDGARVLLTGALVVAGVVLVAIGGARALGVKQPIRAALKATPQGRAAAAAGALS